MKYLLLIGLALIVLWFFRLPGNRRSRAAGTRNMRAARAPERMVKCDRCGIYLPESESIADGAARYCCAEHRCASQDRVD